MHAFFGLTFSSPYRLPPGFTYGSTDSVLRAVGAEHGVAKILIHTSPSGLLGTLVLESEGDMTVGVGLVILQSFQRLGFPSDVTLREFDTAAALLAWAQES